jgi:hypothetical protein
MRRLLALATLLVVQSGALVALPTLTSATATPRPVAASLQQLPLTAAAPSGDVSAALRVRGARPVVTSPLHRTAPFSLMGVTWRDDPAVGEVEVGLRTRTGGRWSAWETVDAHGDDAPDDGSADTRGALRAGTPPIWTGPSDGVQVRVQGQDGAAPQDLRIELVDPGTSPADAVASAPSGSAHAAQDEPAIITRSQWGADESIRRGSPSYTGAARVGFVHHTASSNDYTAAQAAQMVRGIYAYHVKSNGWSDIGYNFLVDRYGRAYEGRAGGMDRWVAGAHTGGFNSNSFGVSLLGDFSTVPPSASTLATLSQVLAWKLGAAYRDPMAKATLVSAGGGTSKYAKGTTATFDVVSGHRDAGSTSCPGATTYARLPAIREMVKADLGAGFAGPVVNRTTFALSSRGPVTLSARTLGELDWTATVTDAAGAELVSARGSDPQVAFSWDLRRADGRAVPAGRYALRLSGSSASDTARTYAATVVVKGELCRGTPKARALCRAKQRSTVTPAG